MNFLLDAPMNVGQFNPITTDDRDVGGGRYLLPYYNNDIPQYQVGPYDVNEEEIRMLLPYIQEKFYQQSIMDSAAPSANLGAIQDLLGGLDTNSLISILQNIITSRQK